MEYTRGYISWFLPGTSVSCAIELISGSTAMTRDDLEGPRGC